MFKIVIPKTATIDEVYEKTGIKYPFKPLKDYCNKIGFVLKKVECNNKYYSEVFTYPAIAWKEGHNVDLDTIM